MVGSKAKNEAQSTQHVSGPRTAQDGDLSILKIPQRQFVQILERSEKLHDWHSNVNIVRSNLGDNIERAQSKNRRRIWRVILRTSIRTWQERLVEAHHRTVFVNEYDGNERFGLVEQESVGQHRRTVSLVFFRVLLTSLALKVQSTFVDTTLARYSHTSMLSFHTLDQV